MSREFATEWLTARRNEAQHSTYSLAQHIGVTPAVIRAIEGGASPGIYQAGLLIRYAEGLGCSLEDLFADPARNVEEDDVALAIATVVAAGGSADVDAFALAVGWSPERARYVLRGCAEPLGKLGLALAWHGDGRVILVTSPHLETPAASMLHETAARDGLTIQQARVVATLSQVEERTRVGDQMSNGYLQACGIVELVPDGGRTRRSSHGVREAVRLSADARFNLVL